MIEKFHPFVGQKFDDVSARLLSLIGPHRDYRVQEDGRCYPCDFSRFRILISVDTNGIIYSIRNG